MADWSRLPTELLGLIALRLLSVLDILRFRSICTSWRSSVSLPGNNPRPLIHVDPLVVRFIYTYNQKKRRPDGRVLSGAFFSRVTLSSSSSSRKGWLIKHDAELNHKTFRLLSPLSRLPFRLGCKTINLLTFNVTEIQPTYIVQKQRKKKADTRFIRVVVERRNDRLVSIGCDRKIRYWNGEIWTRFQDQADQFCDLIVHEGMTYALDSRGIIWWISPARGIFRYGPALDDDIGKSCFWRYRSLVGGCCGNLYIVDRLVDVNLDKIICRSVYINQIKVIRDDVGNSQLESSVRGFYPKTVGFKVYKVDDDSYQWEEVKSLGGNAFVMATDTRFSVLAREYYGCMENSIYFTDEHENSKNYEEIKVFKLDDGSIETMSGDSQSCFEMFVPKRR